ncbi:hypothetical protein BKA91DRAFT_140578 [Yarrowia lipolytica]|nr:hypothetical protein BKA91DRAFT_140578 [Yarrowia lipolytica]KAE8170361.1 hypothetical protein BKA90DRAFT_140933 [Yarrowia lipolytica]RMI95985.1 hypothetical protein BD777DRAFT_129316 [Yarrowia lipolytica]
MLLLSTACVTPPTVSIYPPIRRHYLRKSEPFFSSCLMPQSRIYKHRQCGPVPALVHQRQQFAQLLQQHSLSPHTFNMLPAGVILVIILVGLVGVLLFCMFMFRKLMAFKKRRAAPQY